MSELGKLYYALGLETKDFEQGLSEMAKKVKGLDKDGKINLDSSAVNDAVTKMTELARLIETVKTNAADIKIGELIKGSPKISLDSNDAVKLKADIETAIANCKLTSVDVSSVTTALNSATQNGFPIILTCTANSVAPLIGELNKILNGRKVSIRLYPSMASKDINKLKNEIETKIRDVKLRNVTLDFRNKRDVQASLNAMTGLTVPVEIKLHTATLQSQLNQISSGITLNNSNMGNGNGNNSLEKRVKVQKEVNRHATDELGIRRSINDQMSRNTMLATMFGNAIGNVFATYQITRFLEALVEVGGEIQKQRMALGHILNNEAFASDLFSNMKDLAVKSPYGLLDLMKNARQLSAFGVEYNNLYDTMRRLSDVAAGLGIDFGRISLAYGETLERTYLDGKLIRQFAYMGLPVLQKVAEYYTEINKAGNGSIFSASDVRKMVSNREVSFEDLDAVIKRMTDEGGQFANMQEVMAESVAGKWKNVKDAYDIMLSDMTEGNSQLLKAPAEFLIMLTRNYDALLPLLGAVATAMIGTKAVAALFNATMGKQVAMQYESMIANKQSVAVMKQREAALNGASVAEIRRLATAKLLTAEELNQAITSKEITELDAKSIVLKQGVNKANAESLLTFKLITAEQYKTIMSSNSLGLSWGMLKIKAQMLGIQLKMVAANFREMAAAMLVNPMTWVFAAAAAVMELASAIGKVNDENDKIAKGMRERVSEMGKNAEEIKQRVSLSYEFVDQNGGVAEGQLKDKIEERFKKSGADIIRIDNHDFKKTYTATAAEMQTAIDELVEFIKNNMPGANEALKDVFKLDDAGQFEKDVNERYEILLKFYQDLKNLADNDTTNQLFDGVQDAMGAHWYNAVFSDDLMRDAADYEKYYRDALKSIRDAVANASDEIQPVLRKYKEQFGVVGNAKLFEELLKPENFDKLDKFKDEIANLTSFGSLVSLGFDVRNLKASYKEYVNELESAWSDISKILKTYNLDPNKKEDKRTIEYVISTYLQNTETSQWVKDHMTQDFWTKWGIDISLGGDVEEAKDIIKQIYGGAAKETLADSNDELRKQYKKNKESLKNIQDTNLKGIKANSNGKYDVTGDESAKIKKAKDEANDYIDTLNTLRNTAKSVNIDLEAEWLAEQNKKNKGSSKTEDTQLKIWKEQFDELKKAYSEYQKWLKVVGEGDAMKEVKKIINFDQFKSYGINEADIFDNESYQKAIDKFYKKIISSLNTTDRKKFGTSIKVELSNIEFNGVQQASQELAKNIQEEINNAMKQWDVYKSWFSATGDKTLSLNIALNIKPIATEESEYFYDILKKRLEGIYEDRKAEDAKSAEEFKKVLNKGGLLNMKFSEGTAEMWYTKSGVSELLPLWKKVKELMVSAGYEYSKGIAQSMESLQTSAEKMSVINEKYKKLIDADKTNNNGANVSKLEGARDLEKLKIGNTYITYMQRNLTLTQDAAKDFADIIKGKLLSIFKKGGISADKYAEEIKKINDEMRKIQKSQRGSGTFGSKTFEEAFQSMYDKGYQQFTQGADLEKSTLNMNDALTKFTGQSSEATGEMLQNAQGMQEAGQGMMGAASQASGAIGIVDMIIKGINQTVQALNKSVQYIDEMLASLGNDTGADTAWGQAKSYVSGFAESSQHAADSWENAKSGNFAGMVAEQIGSVTSIVTNFNKLHDAKLQAQIDKMNLQNTTLGNTYSQLQTILERTMGGIYNLKLDDDTRKQLQNVVNNTREYDDTKNANYSSETQKAAQKALESGSYYDAQFANLLAQRDNLQAMYDAENDKKDTDYSGLEDLRSQLSEINDEISYFAEDMMKSLYGIDFKDWASQLGDALIEAWAKGENAADAYAQTVQDLMKSVTKSVISQSIIETALEPTLKAFKESFVSSSGQLDLSQITWLGQQLGALYPQLNEAITQYLEQMQTMGLDLSETTSSSASSSIQNISEETASILAALMQGMRLDLSIQRLAVESIRDAIGVDGRPLNVIAEAQLSQLGAIAENTNRNAQAAEFINETLNAIVAGTKTIHVE